MSRLGMRANAKRSQSVTLKFCSPISAIEQKSDAQARHLPANRVGRARGG
jgi:hypothetical protein